MPQITPLHITHNKLRIKINSLSGSGRKMVPILGTVSLILCDIEFPVISFKKAAD